jgi:hypothetical protein
VRPGTASRLVVLGALLGLVLASTDACRRGGAASHVRSTVAAVAR